MRSASLALFGLAVCVSLLAIALAGPRDEQWKKVDEAVKKGLPKTAIEELNPIIEAALKDKNYPEAIKAIAKKIALEGNIQGNKPEEKITRLEAELAKAPEETKPVLTTILANWYWHYFQQNRWRFMQRTQTAAAPGKDFTTWDLPRILGEIDKQFTAALSHADKLKKIPVGDYNELLEKGNSPDTYRPTLYDFIAFEALDFYSTGEQAGNKSEDTFELLADSPIFAPVEEFLAWAPKTTDEDSLTLRGVKLYQALLKFHQEDKDKTALIDADLWRLNFGNNKAVGDSKQERFIAALKKFAEKYADHEISARARHDWATQVQGQGDLVEARKIALQGHTQFPESVGGKRCWNLIQQIEAKTYNVQLERVWNQPLGTIDVRYKNITKLHFRVVPFDFDEFVKSNRYQPDQLDDAGRKALLAQQPVKAWEVDLKATDDYQERYEQIPAPAADLKPGSYFLIASPEADFRTTNNQIVFNDFWVSELAIVVRTRQGEGVMEGFVLEANSGAPVIGAEVKAWSRNNQGHREVVAPSKTDENGMFRFAGVQRGYLVLATHNERRLATSNEYYVGMYDMTQRPQQHTVFFTDRALYRPGQTIHYKGISMAVDLNTDKYEALKQLAVTILFEDVNGKEIARQQAKTNDYGSLSGSFTAPRDRLLGQMRIRAIDVAPGQANFRVEEYKRPKFQVKLEAPKTAYKLNDEVTLSGKATAYTGAAIDGAKVQWRVVREVRWPAWFAWRRWWWPQPNTGGQEIAHGTAQTGTDGSYTIKFTAKPDLSVNEKDEPTFHYTIHSDVTDLTGETRSDSKVIRLGYTALQAVMSADDWQVDDKPVTITVKTTTLDGEPQAATGTLKIYALKQPNKVYRASLGNQYRPMPMRGGKVVADAAAPPPDPANPTSWPLGDVVFTQEVATDGTGTKKVEAKLPAGFFRAKLETKDRFGKPVSAELPIRVIAPNAEKLALKIPDLFVAPKWTLEPGEKLLAIWGSGYDTAQAYVEIEHRRKVIKAFWTQPGKTQLKIEHDITEEMRGGFTLRVTFVRENRAYLHAQHVNVPWSNKELTIKWERFVSKLQPGQKETWTATVTGKDSKKAVAEMVATLYDASLDAYAPHGYPGGFNVFRQDYSHVQSQFVNYLDQLRYLLGQYSTVHKDGTLTYRHLPAEIDTNLWGYGYFGGRGRGFDRNMAPGAPPEAAASRRELKNADGVEMQSLRKNATDEKRRGLQQADGQGGEAEGPDLSKVNPRKNLNETAFFYPHLVASAEGEVKIEFTMPEALTEWKFMGFAHDTSLRGGLLTDKAVTAKELMAQPNPPRFLREGDIVEFTMKVTNQSPTRQTGMARLSLLDARSLDKMDAAFGLTVPDQPFDIPTQESRTISWRITVPNDAGYLIYRTVASTGKLSDGEEGFLPVLSRRILVTESLTLPIRGPMTKDFTFDRLTKAGESKTLKSKTLTVQMVSNPSWYAVMALPYLMDYPHECTEQTFNRLYANSLARHIANSDPKIHRIFELWRGTPALDSPLEKNQDMKSVMLEETPWVRQAMSESQARRNVGILFEDNRLNDETARLLAKLADQQLGDGAWPWFPGGPANDYITLYITTGFGRLRHLGAKVDVAPAIKSLGRLDAWVDRMYQEILKHPEHKDKNHLSTTIAFYLYGRSFFLKDKPIVKEHQAAIDYWHGQARTYWLQLDCRQSQGHLAIALKRWGDQTTPAGIMKSIKERSVSNEELGMFWRDLELSYWWFRAPIETQAMMIEAFDEVMNDQQAVEDCKVWLLKQKQTQDWKTTKATADAVYALLLRGTDVLASDKLVAVTLGGEEIKPETTEAGTGFYEQRFVGGEIKPELGKITVKKVDAGVAWGNLTWQYLEDMNKVTPYEGTPLKLKKTIFTKQPSKKGPVLTPIAGPVAVGDELVVRVELRVDRDMEYIHLKDFRGSGVEPVNVLSQYRYQDGLAYYESTRDTASHFFIDYLPKGVYVFEYSTRVQLRGQYQTGVASIQCMYAPEFNSHSESVMLEVK